MRKKTMIGRPGNTPPTPTQMGKTNYEMMVNSEDNKWVEYHFNADTIKKLKGKSESQLKEIHDAYENFVFGHLYHYDMVIRNGADPHLVYFKWFHGHSGVRVALDPAPKVANSPYPYIQKSIDDFDPQKAYKDPIGENDKREDDWISPRVGGVDPTPPPPPPPPDSLR